VCRRPGVSALINSRPDQDRELGGHVSMSAGRRAFSQAHAQPNALFVRHLRSRQPNGKSKAPEKPKLQVISGAFPPKSMA
jgi:hypothetical protein